MGIFMETYEGFTNGIHSSMQGIHYFFTVFLIIVNFIVVLCGMVLFCFTFYAIWIFNTYKDLVIAPGSGEEAVYGVLVAGISVIAVSGIILILLGMLGAAAAYTTNRSLLLTNCILMAILFAVLLTAFIFVEKSKEKLHKTFKFSIARVYHQKPNSTLPGPNLKELPATNAWALLQRSFQCCGYDNGTDWTIYNNYTDLQMVQGYMCTNETLEHGCKEALEDPLYWVKVTVIIIIVLQGIALVGSAYLLLEETLEEWTIENGNRERERNRRTGLYNRSQYNRPWLQVTYADRNDVAVQQASADDSY